MARRYPHHLKKYMFKKRRRKSRRRKHRKQRRTRKGTHHMARRRRSHRRRGHRRAHRTYRRRGHRGGRTGLMPSREDFTLIAGAAAIGFLESKAKGDAGFILNKVPRPIKQLGYTGGTALALQVAAHFTHNRWLKLLAKSAWMVAGYQIGALGKVPDAADKPFSLSGMGEENYLGDGTLGHLSAEGEAMEGLPYDDRVELPMT